MTRNTLDGVVATEILFLSHFEEETVCLRQGLLLYEPIGNKLKGFNVLNQNDISSSDLSSRVVAYLWPQQSAKKPISATSQRMDFIKRNFLNYKLTKSSEALFVFLLNIEVVKE